MPTHRPLTEFELERVNEGVRLAIHLVGTGGPLTLDDLQRLYDALLSEPDPPPAAKDALGYAFGQLFLQHDWLCWAVLLDDEYGDEIGIAVKNRQVSCAPISMVRNRLEDGEAWDFAELMEATVKRLRQLGQHAAPD